MSTELLFHLGGMNKFVPTTITVDTEAVVRLSLTNDTKVVAYAQALVERHKHLLDIVLEPETPPRTLLGIAMQKKNLLGLPVRIVFSGKIIEFDPISEDEASFDSRELRFDDPGTNPDPDKSVWTRRVLETFRCQDLRTRIGTRSFGELERMAINLSQAPPRESMPRGRYDFASIYDNKRGRSRCGSLIASKVPCDC